MSWATSSGVDLHLELPQGRGRRAALEEALREGIRDGRLASGERLPASRVLARELGVARGTVTEAYAQLCAEGYLAATRGSGTVVADAPGLSPSPDPEPPLLAPGADFRLGRPDLTAFPHAAWVRAMRKALRETPAAVLGPGDPRGTMRLRETLAAYLGRVRGVVTDPGLVVVCSGFIQGLRLVSEALKERGGRTLALEDPCLPDHRLTVAAAGLEVLPLPVDEAGAQPAGLVAAPDAVVLTPAHQAPLGATLPADRRAAFVRWAAEGGGVVIEDDYDGEFRYDRKPIGALQGLHPEAVVYAGTASKALAPGMRLGWLALPSALLEPVVEAKRRVDRGTEVLAQLALAELIDSGGLDRHVRQMRLRYRGRRDRLVAMLAKRASALRIIGTAAGLHAVALLPHGGPSEDELSRVADQRSVAFNLLGQFWHEPRDDPQGIVVGYGTPPEHGYSRALDRLGKVLAAAAS